MSLKSVPFYSLYTSTKIQHIYIFENEMLFSDTEYFQLIKWNREHFISDVYILQINLKNEPVFLFRMSGKVVEQANAVERNQNTLRHFNIPISVIDICICTMYHIYFNIILSEYSRQFSHLFSLILYIHRQSAIYHRTE